MLKKVHSDSGLVTVGHVNATKAVAKYIYHLRSITIIRQIIPLMIASQLHRGAQLALMEGGKYFEEKVKILQAEIDSRFTTLLLLNKELSTPLQEQQIKLLLQEWDTLQDWNGGPVLENFNLHSHFIEQLMRLIWSVSEKSNYFLVKLSRDTKSNSHKNHNSNDSISASADDGLLSKFVLQEIPELIELLARIRGLATHSSVIKQCDAEHKTWLEFLLKQLKQKNEKFRVLIRSLQIYALRDLPALIDIEIQDVGIVQLIQFVENNILRDSDIEVNGHNVFMLTTNIINSYNKVVKQGIDFIQNKINQQLDSSHPYVS